MGGVLRAQGAGGGVPSKRHLVPDPHLGVLDARKSVLKAYESFLEVAVLLADSEKSARP